MPFFAGNATLKTTVELTPEQASTLTFLRFQPLGANSWRFRINGKPAGECLWGPYAVPVAGLLQPGPNEIEVELTMSLRNLLGPHHLEEGESYAVNTMSFNKEPNFAGRKAPPYNAGYCFVELGIKDIHLA